jgi:hypothetical protein
MGWLMSWITVPGVIYSCMHQNGRPLHGVRTSDILQPRLSKNLQLDETLKELMHLTQDCLNEMRVSQMKHHCPT